MDAEAFSHEVFRHDVCNLFSNGREREREIQKERGRGSKCEQLVNLGKGNEGILLVFDFSLGLKYLKIAKWEGKTSLWVDKKDNFLES